MGIRGELPQGLLPQVHVAQNWHLRVLASALLPAALALSASAAVWFHLLQIPTPAALIHASIVFIAIFAASIVAAMAGFAFSAVAAALLVHAYHDPAEMVRMMLLCSIAVQLYCNARLLKKVRWLEVTPYLVGGLVSAPLGIVLLRQVSWSAYGCLLGLLLVAYSVYALTNPLQVKARSIGIDMAVGAMGGITGGVAAFPGAFPVIWCSARGLSKEHQRAICQPYILVMQVCTLGWFEYAYHGQLRSLMELWTLIPVALAGAWLGFEIFRRCSLQQFRTAVLALLAICGALLIGKGW